MKPVNNFKQASGLLKL